MSEENPKPTFKQGITIFNHLGYDIRPTSMTRDDASFVIGLSLDGEIEAAVAFLVEHGAEQKYDVLADGSRSDRRKAKKVERAERQPAVNGDAKWELLYETAIMEGLKAANRVESTPIFAATHANPLDDGSPVVGVSAVGISGDRGMAYIKLDKRTAFAQWAERNDKLSNGGVLITPGFGRGSPLAASYEYQSAYHGAIYATLSKAGVKNMEFFSRVD